VRVVGLDFLTGKIMSAIGPKKTMFIGFVVSALSMLMFASQEVLNWPIIVLGLIWGATHSLVVLPLQDEFSKIHNVNSEGSQIGYLHVVEKLGSVLGPLVGGIIATVFGGQYIFIAGLVMLILAGIPLLMSRESVRTHQKLNLRKVNLKKYHRNIFAFAIGGIDQTMATLWLIFISVAILASGTAYMGVGILQSISVVAAIASAIVVGRFVDRKYGRKLLRIGFVVTAIFNVSRIFISKYIPALASNIGYEVSRTAATIPRDKGFYDDADDDETRAAYVVITDYLDSVLKCLAWIVVLVVSVSFGFMAAIYTGLGMAALSALFAMTEKYKALN
jgi:MFS family permease